MMFIHTDAWIHCREQSLFFFSRMGSINTDSSIQWSSLTRLQRAFMFTPPSDTEFSFSGEITSYPGGGYVADLTENVDEASRLVRALEESGWFDEYTRAVVVEFNVLNPNSKLFNQIIVALEYTTDGGTWWTCTVSAVQLYRYTEGRRVRQ